MTKSFSEDQRAFYHTYGLAMAFWAEVWADLGDHFMRIAGLPEKVGSPLYSSARSFLGRVDMLSAVVPPARTVPDGRKFLTRAVNIAKNWSGGHGS